MSSEENNAQLCYNGNYTNPYIKAPNADYGIQFSMDLEWIQADANEFKEVVKSAVNRFRHSECYTGYKNFLYSLGLDHCQVYGNISADMADLEMHHNGLTIFDIAVMIAYHIVNVNGKVNSLNIFSGLRDAHSKNKVPIVMLSKTVHHVYTDEGTLTLPADMCVGNWYRLITDYHYGITYSIAKKLYAFFDVSINPNLENNEQNMMLLQLRNEVKKWSDYNEYGGSNYINPVVPASEYRYLNGGSSPTYSNSLFDEME